MRVGLAVLLVAVALGPGCGGSDSGFTSATEATQTLTGTWQATKAEYTSRSNSSQKVDIVARGSALTLVLDPAGTFRLTIVDPGQPGNVVTGTWTASRDILTIVQSGRSGNTQFDIVLSGARLTLTGGHVQFDLNNDGTVEECVLDMSLNRV